MLSLLRFWLVCTPRSFAVCSAPCALVFLRVRFVAPPLAGSWQCYSCVFQLLHCLVWVVDPVLPCLWPPSLSPPCLTFSSQQVLVIIITIRFVLGLYGPAGGGGVIITLVVLVCCLLSFITCLSLCAVVGVGSRVAGAL